MASDDATEGGRMTAEVALAHGAPFTVNDLFAMPDDGQRYEVQDGALIVSPAPGVPHQLIVDDLVALLKAAAPQGAYAVSGIAVRLHDDENGRVPDVSVISAHPRSRRGAAEATETLAVIEVVSPGSVRTDRVFKPAIYAEAGIPCFWRVEMDPFPGQVAGEELPVVLVHQLVGDHYKLVARLSAGTTGTVDVPFPVTFDPATLLD
jgi:Uma2 family endonuclease